MLSFGSVSTCQICQATALAPVLDLGFHALPSAYLTQTQLQEPETVYPLRLIRCIECGLLQLDYIVDPAQVFPPQYPYQTGMTNMLVKNFESLAAMVIPALKLTPNDLVVDIGSNDGSLLKPFKAQRMRVLGIEPTDTAHIARSNGVETIQEYVTVSVARAAVQQHGRAKLVTAANVFAHIPDPSAVVEAIKELMDEDAVFVSESQYLMDIMEKLEIDTVYHEHLRFYSLKPLQKLFEKCGMSIVDAERIAAAGGSIRVFAKKGSHAPSARVGELLADEEAAGLYDGAVWERFAEKAVTAKQALIELLLTCRAKGHIMAIGSPVRANTLMGFCHLDTTLIRCCVERANSPKIGLWTPGTHIPVESEQRLLDEQPPYALVNSWHIGTELMEKLRSLGYRGTFIVPLPTPRLVPPS